MRNFRDYGFLDAMGYPQYPFMIPVGACMHPVWINAQLAKDKERKHTAHGLTFVTEPRYATREYMVHHHEGYTRSADGNNLPFFYSTVSSKLWFVSAIQLPNKVMPVSTLKIETGTGINSHVPIDELWNARLGPTYSSMLGMLNTDYLFVEFPKPIERSDPLTEYWGFAIFIR